MSNQAGDDDPLPPGWRKVASNSRPGVPCYQHEHGRKMFKRPTATDATTAQKPKKPRASTNTVSGSSPPPPAGLVSVRPEPSPLPPPQPKTAIIELVNLVQEEQTEGVQTAENTVIGLIQASKAPDLPQVKPDVSNDVHHPPAVKIAAAVTQTTETLAPSSPRRNADSAAAPITPSPSKQGSRIVGSGSATRRKQMGYTASIGRTVKRTVDPAEDAEFDFKPEPKHASRDMSGGQDAPASPLSDAGPASQKAKETGPVAAASVEDTGKSTAPVQTSARPSIVHLKQASNTKTATILDIDMGKPVLGLGSSSTKVQVVQKEANTALPSNTRALPESAKLPGEISVPKADSAVSMFVQSKSSGSKTVQTETRLDRQQSGQSRNSGEQHSRDDGASSRRSHGGHARSEPPVRSASGPGRESSDRERRSKEPRRRGRSSSPSARRRRDRSKSYRGRDRSRSPKKRSRSPKHRSRSPTHRSFSSSDKRQPSDFRSRARPMPAPSAQNHRVTSEVPPRSLSTSPVADLTSLPPSRGEQQTKAPPIQSQSVPHRPLPQTERKPSEQLRGQGPQRKILSVGHPSHEQSVQKTVPQQPLYLQKSVQPQSDQGKYPTGREDKESGVPSSSGEASHAKHTNGTSDLSLAGSAISVVTTVNRQGVGVHPARETQSKKSFADNQKSELIRKVRELCPVDRSSTLVKFVQEKLRFCVEANGFIVENGSGQIGSVGAVLSFLGLVTDEQALSRTEVPDKAALRSLRLAHGRYPSKYVSAPLVLLSSLKEAWICRVSDEASGKAAAFLVETQGSKVLLGTGANPKSALLEAMTQSCFSFRRSTGLKRSYIFTKPEGCIINLQATPGDASKVEVKHVDFSWQAAAPSMNNPCPFRGDEVLFVTFGDDDVWMPICKDSVKLVIARESEIKKLRYKSCCHSISPLSQFVDLIERKNPLAEALDLPSKFFEHDAAVSEIAHEMFGVGPGRLCALESVHKRIIEGERYSHQLVGMEETSKMTPKYIAAARAKAEKRMEYIVASGFFEPDDPTAWNPLLFPTASLFPFEKTPPPAEINSARTGLREVVDAIERPVNSKTDLVAAAGHVPSADSTSAGTVSARGLPASLKTSFTELEAKISQASLPAPTSSSVTLVALQPTGSPDSPLMAPPTITVAHLPSSSALNASTTVANIKGLTHDNNDGAISDETIRRFLEEKVFRSCLTRHRFDSLSYPLGFFSRLIEETSIAFPNEDNDTSLVLRLMVAFLAAQEEPAGNEDLRPIVAASPMTLAKVLERLEKRFPDRDLGWRVADLHRFYISLKPDVDEDLLLPKVADGKEVKRARYALRGLKGKLSMLNGLYQLTETAGVELYSFIGDEVGRMGEEETAMIASKFALLHFPEYMWVLGSMGGGALEGCVCAADETAKKWASVSTSGSMDWDPDVTLEEVTVIPLG